MIDRSEIVSERAVSAIRILKNVRFIGCVNYIVTKSIRDVKMTTNDLIKGSSSKAKEITAYMGLNFMKINEIYRTYESLPKEDSYHPIGITLSEVKPDGTRDISVNENDIILLRRQAFKEILFLSGVSIFDKFSKDWYRWGLKYSNKLIEHYGKEVLTITEIIKSKEVKETIMDKIVDNIKFTEAEACKNAFKRVFEIEVFKDSDEQYKFQKYLNYRHLFAHHCGYIDNRFIKNMGFEEDTFGALLLIDDKQINEFLNMLHEIVFRIRDKITEKIVKEIKK